MRSDIHHTGIAGQFPDLLPFQLPVFHITPSCLPVASFLTGNQKALRSHPDTQAFLAALLALGDAPADEAAAAGELPEVRAARSLFR
jgi:hypothetical protein